MIKAISGGQTGADMGAVSAALDCGFQPGGTMPWQFANETARHSPSWAAKYGFTQTRKPANSGDWKAIYKERTHANVRDADATIWFQFSGLAGSPGYYCTRNAAESLQKKFYLINCEDKRNFPKMFRVDLIRILFAHDIVNFSGSRESKAPGIYDWVYGTLTDVFTELKSEQTK